VNTAILIALTITVALLALKVLTSGAP